MTKKHIVWYGDWILGIDGTPLTGYGNISSAFATELSKEYSLIALGFAYQRNQHQYPFSLTHVAPQHLQAALININNAWRIDHLVVAADITLQREVLKIKGNWKYNGIFAVESSPLYTPWAMDLSIMDNAFTISEFGKSEAEKVGVSVQHLVAPVDRSIWKPKTKEEQDSIKDVLGVKNKVVLFINAAGNERKNTSIVFEALKNLKNSGHTEFYLYVLTNLNNGVSWDLKELRTRFELEKQITLLDKGLVVGEVRNLYAAADFVINTSKAEGMGYPILEAMSVGTTTIITNATAMADHADGGKRAIAIKPDYVAIDPFGNTDRFYIFPESLEKVLLDASEALKNDPTAFDNMNKLAQDYIDERNNTNSIELLRKALNE